MHALGVSVDMYTSCSWTPLFFCPGNQGNPGLWQGHGLTDKRGASPDVPVAQQEVSGSCSWTGRHIIHPLIGGNCSVSFSSLVQKYSW